ncbi:HdeD family acid-resistance protein [Olivibacter sitiensis]|uniref:HdeD family acid-resistance protein n=1 Tax=Olivibacter sitiensis TaxID=376470 RepID=UPI0004100ADB|nr:DUF308 domain-containing protein [Olivibacter sitiensis]
MGIIKTLKKDVSNWWLFLVIGILLLLASFYTLSNPVASYLGLAVFFGSFIFINGILRVSFAIGNSNNIPSWGWTLVAGILDIILGLILLSYPVISMQVLPFIVGFYVLMAGISLISHGLEEKDFGLSGWGWLVFGGVLTILLGLAMIFNPVIGVATIIFWTSAAFMVSGIFHLVLAFNLRRLKKKFGE